MSHKENNVRIERPNTTVVSFPRGQHRLNRSKILCELIKVERLKQTVYIIEVILHCFLNKFCQ